MPFQGLSVTRLHIVDPEAGLVERPACALRMARLHIPGLLVTLRRSPARSCAADGATTPFVLAQIVVARRHGQDRPHGGWWGRRRSLWEYQGRRPCGSPSSTADSPSRRTRQNRTPPGSAAWTTTVATPVKKCGSVLILKLHGRRPASRRPMWQTLQGTSRLPRGNERQIGLPCTELCQVARPDHADRW